MAIIETESDINKPLYFLLSDLNALISLLKFIIINIQSAIKEIAPPSVNIRK